LSADRFAFSLARKIVGLLGQVRLITNEGASAHAGFNGCFWPTKYIGCLANLAKKERVTNRVTPGTKKLKGICHKGK